MGATEHGCILSQDERRCALWFGMCQKSILLFTKVIFICTSTYCILFTARSNGEILCSYRGYKDISLVSMASLLYRSNYPQDALLIARATLNICGDNSVAPAIYTMIGLILAVHSSFTHLIVSCVRSLNIFFIPLCLCSLLRSLMLQ